MKITGVKGILASNGDYTVIQLENGDEVILEEQAEHTNYINISMDDNYYIVAEIDTLVNDVNLEKARKAGAVKGG